MVNRKKPAIEVDLKAAFGIGYGNAALSLRKLTKKKVYYNNFHDGFCRLDTHYFADPNLFTGNGSKLLLTTEIFGDLAGKSYLVMSEEEYRILTDEIPESNNPEIDFKEEFAKELDNILSASVITALSNELNLKVYGDIPVMVGQVGDNILKVIYDDFSGHSREVFMTAIHFSFENQPAVRPCFIWVVNSKALKVLESNSIV